MTFGRQGQGCELFTWEQAPMARSFHSWQTWGKQLSCPMIGTSEKHNCTQIPAIFTPEKRTFKTTWALFDILLPCAQGNLVALCARRTRCQRKHMQWCTIKCLDPWTKIIDFKSSNHGDCSTWECSRNSITFDRVKWGIQVIQSGKPGVKFEKILLHQQPRTFIDYHFSCKQLS